MTQHAKNSEQPPRVLVARDTRISGQMLEQALIAGLLSVGIEVFSLGVITTPGVAYLVRLQAADAGVMISASHNPVQDNGIKFFGGDGYKLSDDQEEEIQRFIGKFRASNRTNRTILLGTLDFLAEQLLSAQRDTDMDNSK